MGQMEKFETTEDNPYAEFETLNVFELVVELWTAL